MADPRIAGAGYVPEQAAGEAALLDVGLRPVEQVVLLVEVLDLTVALVRSEDGAAPCLLVEAREVVGTGGQVLLTARGTELLA